MLSTDTDATGAAFKLSMTGRKFWRALVYFAMYGFASKKICLLLRFGLRPRFDCFFAVLYYSISLTGSSRLLRFPNWSQSSRYLSIKNFWLGILGCMVKRPFGGASLSLKTPLLITLMRHRLLRPRRTRKFLLSACSNYYNSDSEGSFSASTTSASFS